MKGAILQALSVWWWFLNLPCGEEARFVWWGGSWQLGQRTDSRKPHFLGWKEVCYQTWNSISRNGILSWVVFLPEREMPADKDKGDKRQIDISVSPGWKQECCCLQTTFVHLCEISHGVNLFKIIVQKESHQSWRPFTHEARCIDSGM